MANKTVYPLPMLGPANGKHPEDDPFYNYKVAVRAETPNAVYFHPFLVKGHGTALIHVDAECLVYRVLVPFYETLVAKQKSFPSYLYYYESMILPLLGPDEQEEVSLGMMAALDLADPVLAKEYLATRSKKHTVVEVPQDDLPGNEHRSSI